MLPISLKIIRESSHALSQLTADEILLMRVINLENKGISKIDNLDPFGELQELNLRKNRITCVENLEFQSEVCVHNSQMTRLTPTPVIYSPLPRSFLDWILASTA